MIPLELRYNHITSRWESSYGDPNPAKMKLIYTIGKYHLYRVGQYLYGGQKDSGRLNRIKRPNDALVEELILKCMDYDTLKREQWETIDGGWGS